MTALVASVGFLPIAVSKGSGAERLRPLATVVTRGVITSALFTLIILQILLTFRRSVWLIRSRASQLRTCRDLPPVQASRLPDLSTTHF
jgi:Cu/Ag efflux pump CusA